MPAGVNKTDGSQVETNTSLPQTVCPFDAKKAKTHFKQRLGLGQVGRPSDAGGGKNARGMAELTNAIQKFFVETGRLKIPVIFHEECLHGHAAMDGTSFPQPIGLGSHPLADGDLIELSGTMLRFRLRTPGPIGE